MEGERKKERTGDRKGDRGRERRRERRRERERIRKKKEILKCISMNSRSLDPLCFVSLNTCFCM